MNFNNKLLTNPIIAATRNNQELEYAINSNASVIFILSTDIFRIQKHVKRIRDLNKSVFIHLDFLEGLGRDKKAIEYIARVIKPNGIISTRTNLIKYANEIGLYSIQRFFIIDSKSLETCIKTITTSKPHMIEIMPGIMPEIIELLNKKVNVPIIVGGLISKKEHINQAIAAGAKGVSSSKKELW